MTEQTSLNLSSIEITAGRAIDQLLQIRSPKITALPDFVKRDSRNLQVIFDGFDDRIGAGKRIGDVVGVEQQCVVLGLVSYLT